MIRRRVVLSISFVLAFATCVLRAQVSPELAELAVKDNPRSNVHIGAPMAIPVGHTADAVHLGFGINVGGGYNFNRHHGLVGELLWNGLSPTNEALAKIRTTLKDPNVEASVDITELTGNYRYEMRGRNLGAYFIGGAGFFYRHTTFSKEAITGRNIECTPTWVWWGFQCTSGFVTENQTIGNWSATAPGYNAGGGLTFRVGEPPYRFYAESRYHFAPNSRIDTKLMEITFGIRY